MDGGSWYVQELKEELSEQAQVFRVFPSSATVLGRVLGPGIDCVGRVGVW